MKAVILTLFALIASAFAFAPNQAPQGESTASSPRWHHRSPRCCQDQPPLMPPLALDDASYLFLDYEDPSRSLGCTFMFMLR
jgi:hypothetical protein